VNALSISRKTGAVLVRKDVCVACGNCIEACPGRIPHMHPRENYILICDLCGGNPKCVKVCQEGKWNVLAIVSRKDQAYKLYARTPEEITRSLAIKFYGEQGAEYL
jgi:Fe-S-cluster-containing dehydrogenase component